MVVHLAENRTVGQYVTTFRRGGAIHCICPRASIVNPSYATEAKLKSMLSYNS